MDKIERELRTVKERVRCITGEFPFQSIPTMVLMYVVYSVCVWMDIFLIMQGITGGFSPRELVIGLTVNFLRNCQFDVGAYVEASTDAIIINDNSDRTHPCIYLGPSGNRQGLHNCFSLDTGRVVVQRLAKQMSWPDRL